MVKEEIAAGLRNALARGEPLERAMRSFVNAGYNPQEVQQAAYEISNNGEVGVTGRMQAYQTQTGEETPEPSAFIEQETTRKFPWKFVVILLIFIVLLAIAGILMFFII